MKKTFKTKQKLESKLLECGYDDYAGYVTNLNNIELESFMNEWLVYVVLQGNKEFVEFLIELKVNVNAQDQDGRTAMHQAAKYPKEGIRKILIEAGADLDLKDNFGNKPLYYSNEDYFFEYKAVSMESNLLEPLSGQEYPVSLTDKILAKILTNVNPTIKEKLAINLKNSLDVLVANKAMASMMELATKEND